MPRPGGESVTCLSPPRGAHRLDYDRWQVVELEKRAGVALFPFDPCAGNITGNAGGLYRVLSRPPTDLNCLRVQFACQVEGPRPSYSVAIG